MHYTYILRSKSQPGAIYIGSTGNLRLRLIEHNNPNNKMYSKRYAPWEIETYLSFSNSTDSKRFEKYLKSSSGKAFLKKRLISRKFNLDLDRFKNGRKLSVTK